MTHKVLVIGGSDQGRQVIDTIETAGTAEIVGVADRARPRGSEVSGYPVLGAIDDLQHFDPEAADTFIVAIGDNFARAWVTHMALAWFPHLRPISAIHPQASVSPTAQIGPGSIVLAGAVVNNGCTVGRGVLLGSRSSLDHDGHMGDFSSLGPGATLGGTVSVGECTAIGLGANVIHRVVIGDHTVVGAGALVLGDVPDHVTAYGLPAAVVGARHEGAAYLVRRERT